MLILSLPAIETVPERRVEGAPEVPFRGRRSGRICHSVRAIVGKAAIVGVRFRAEVGSPRPMRKLPNVRRWTAARNVDSNTT